MTVFILADHCNLRSGIVQLTRGDWLTASGDISCKGGNKILKYFVIIFLILGDYTWNRGLNCQLLHVQTPVYNSLIIDCSQGTIQKAFSDVLLLYSAKFCWLLYYSLLSSEHIVGVMWWHFSSPDRMLLGGIEMRNKKPQPGPNTESSNRHHHCCYRTSFDSPQLLLCKM